MAVQNPQDSVVELFSVNSDTIRQLVPTIFDQAAYEKPPEIHDETTGATTWAKPEKTYFESDSRVQAQIEWHRSRRSADETIVTFSVFDVVGLKRTPNRQRALELAAVARDVVRDWIGRQPLRKADAPPPDPVIEPGGSLEKTLGGRLEQTFTGTLRDYSGCATKEDLTGLTSGDLPLGRYAFGIGKSIALGPDLFLSKFNNGGPMEYNGVLICAPQNSGKTTLVVRWARAATRAKKPFAVFIVDVKGTLRDKIGGKLAGDKFYFTTDPHDNTGHRINFLDGPKGLDAIDTDRIRQLATALLPSRGFVESGGPEEYYYRNRVIWLTAFIHILKLSQYYCPDWYTDDKKQPCNVDLSDLYTLMEDEDILVGYYQTLKEQENLRRRKREFVPARGIEYWFQEIAIMMRPDPERFPMGQRVEKDTFRSYTIGMLSALEPFAPNGTLHARTRSFGSQPQFDLEGVLGGERRPVTVIMAARQQDLDKAEAVLALSIKRLQWFLFDRMSQADAKDRPVLLLLDETRRIRDFDAAEYVTFAREAKAACVIVYQSLDQIGRVEKIMELLENVGTQIYLGSLVGNTAKYFISVLPKRWRTTLSRQIVRSQNAETTTTSIGREQVDFFSTTDLYQLPAGPHAALVHINDQPRGKPFFVDITDPEA